jgi:hypothetical protein
MCDMEKHTANGKIEFSVLEIWVSITALITIVVTM